MSPREATAYSLVEHEALCSGCSTGIEPSGPAVLSYRPRRNPDGPWRDHWVPFVEDLRTVPQRLVHAQCFAAERGLDALLDVVHAHDRSTREAEYRHWRASHGIQ